MTSLAKKPKAAKREMLVIGWMEHLDLPDMEITQLKAKIDTGARTSALHAQNIEIFEKNDAEWVRFEILDYEHSIALKAECPVHDRRHIKNTSGIPEERVIIRTRLGLAGRTWLISVSLTDRSGMRFPMIVGRTALKNHNIAVHTRRANLTRKSVGTGL